MASNEGAKRSNSPQTQSLSGIFHRILLVLFIGIIAWAYQATQPSPPRTCGSPDGHPITSPRMKLRDGRHLAYKEHGVPKDMANYKIVYIHAFDSCRHDALVADHASSELVVELGLYIVSFDRAGYGESDPHPKKTLKSIALDVEELADHLGLGPKFYVIGCSMGGEFTWTCLKYIPHRLAGVALLAPIINYWWPSFPANLSKEAFYQQLPADLWASRVAHYAPWLTYWWNTQTWFPGSNVIAGVFDHFPPKDLEIISKLTENNVEHARQQGEYESIHQDLNIGFGTWEFDPLELKNPFPKNEGLVHLWHGTEDPLVPLQLQRYVAQQLSWIHYHELPGMGHMFPYDNGLVDTIIKRMLGR
ncbi:hypothetical protein K2173_012145 [Erythroxylum novogranatense]|uniref:AB hydrolase-1 domain-containing protein n=1 Tax=Erythroxylum novogranatense TaxID=1862640 RepID=A0AAV8SRW2_9ROSI|nr:hypothetical protein K2173_012145 [Erythroxylum novogranatense]